MKKTSLQILLTAAIAILCVGTAKAQIVLNVDWSNLSAVKFTATGNVSATDYGAGYKYEDGIALLNFFPSNVTQKDLGSLNSSTLYDSSNSSIFFNILSSWDDTSHDNSTPGPDLTLWADDTTLMNFSTGASAFHGEAIFDLSGESSYTNLFPALNSTGNVVVWSGAATLGTWKVVGASAVPEPSTYAILLGLAAMLGTLAVRWDGPRTVK